MERLNDYVFWLTTPDGTAILGRCLPTEPKNIVLHHLIGFTKIATRKGYLVKLTRNGQELTRQDFKPTESTLSSYHGWRRKIRKLYPEAIFDGNKDICQAFTSDQKRIDAGQWNGETGSVYTY